MVGSAPSIDDDTPGPAVCSVSPPWVFCSAAVPVTASFLFAFLESGAREIEQMNFLRDTWKMIRSSFLGDG